MRPIDADALMEELKVFCDWCRDGRKQGADFVLDCVIPNEKTLDIHTEWIPCSERLPEESDYYLVTFDSITRPVGIFFFEAQYGGCWVDEMGNRLRSKFFVAWMPLPKPYEVDE